MKSLLIIFALVGFGKALDYSFASEGGDVTKLAGEEVSFRCEVAGVLGPTSFVSWMNGTNLMFFGRTPTTSDPRIKLLDENGVEGPSESNVYDLVIKDLTVQDEGTFICGISGLHAISQSYILTVNIMPIIRMEPAERSMDVMLGDAVNAACVVVEGKPEVTVTWSREDNAPVFENGEDHHVGEDLSFTAAEKRHTGTYLCAAENDAGTVTEEIKINVLYAPNVTVDSNVIHTGPEEETKITCNFDANPEVNVSWKHNDMDINFAERSHIEYEQKHGRASLIIKGVKEEDLGVYLCKGGNGKGKDAEAVIKLSALPFELRILSEEQSQYSDGYLLEWQVGSVPPLIECNLRVEELNSTGEYFLGNNTIPAQLGAMTHEYQITDLHANGTYRLELDCRNEFGSTPTEVLEFRTSEQHRPVPTPTTTTPKPVKETDAMKEMNTLDESSKVVVTEESFTIYVEKTVTENPNGGASQVAMNLILLLLTTLAIAW